MSLIDEMKARKSGQIEAQKRLLDTAIAQKRDLSDTEQREFDKLADTVTDLDHSIRKYEETEEEDRSVATAISRLGVSSHNPGDTDIDRQFRDAILRGSRAPIEVTNHDRRSAHQPGVERRTISTTSNVGTTFWNQLQAHMVDSAAVLSAGATVISTDSGEALKVPKSTAMSTAAIVTEGATIATSDPTLGVADLGSYKYGFLTSITRELAEDSKFDIVGYLAEQAGQAIGNAAGAHFVSGTGTGQPRGILADTTAGVTGGTAVAGAFTADNLIDLYYSVISPYARSNSAAWLMRTSTLGAVRKLKDSSGRYLFDANVPTGTGASGTLLGRLVYCDPAMPAVGLGAKSVVFGAVDRYWVRQVNGLRFERSEDHGFATDTIWFRGLARLDGTTIDTTGALKHFVGGAS